MRKLSVLKGVIREGSRKMLDAAISAEVQEYLNLHKALLDEKGHKIIVANGYLPEREILTGIGSIGIKQPRVRNKQPSVGNDEIKPFISKLFPKYLRRIPSIDNLIRILYLKGISTGQMKDALAPLFGENAKNLSANMVCKLKKKWEDEFEAFSSFTMPSGVYSLLNSFLTRAQITFADLKAWFSKSANRQIFSAIFNLVSEPR